MGNSRVVVVAVLAVAAWGAVGAGDAGAQVCGDADGSGAVTVTDGVQALRAAAGLSTSCGAGRCDVDGSGAITVTDGVNVLRKAAGLVITEACAGGSTSESVRAFLGEMTKIARVTGAGAAGVAAASLSGVVNAFTTECDEGFIELDGTTSTFVNCRFGNLLINGALTSTTVVSDPENGRFVTSSVFEQYEVRFLDTGFTFRQDGTSMVDIDTKAKKLVENGTLTIFTTGSALGQDEYTLTKKDLTTDTQTGTVMNGQLISALAEAGLAGIKAVTLGYTVGALADVDVEFDDGRLEAFTYDITTGELTPASLAAAGARALRREGEEAEPPRRSWRA